MTRPYSEAADVLATLPEVVLAARRHYGYSLRAMTAEIGLPSYSTLHRLEARTGGSTTGTLIAVLEWLDQNYTCTCTDACGGPWCTPGCPVCES
jgi:hypothetical protein